VTGTVVPPTAATIAEIQESTAPDGASPLVGTVVATQGTVSALNGTSGFFLQDGTGPWTGIYVFNAPGTLAIGDAITLTGTVAEFNGQTQLTGLSSLNVVSSGNALPATLISTAAGNTEPYESVLAVVAPATCTAQGSFGQYTVNDGGGTLLVDDVIYAHPFVVGTTYSITGVVQYAFNEWRMLPRFAADVELYNSVTDLNGTVLRSYPNPAMDLFTIELQRTAVRTELRMIDANGRLVRSELITGDRAILDVSGMAEGLYTVSLMLDNGAEHVRVMVQH
jgi:hypothetical protein